MAVCVLKIYKDTVMSRIKNLKKKQSPIRIASHQLEENRERRKKCLKSERNIPKKMLLSS